MIALLWDSIKIYSIYRMDFKGCKMILKRNLNNFINKCFYANCFIRYMVKQSTLKLKN